MSQILTGIVVSDKMLKTVVVDVQRRFQHPRFKKIVNIHKKFKVHVEGDKPQIGTVVKIKQTKPISKDKHFILLSIAAKGESSVAAINTTLPAKQAKAELKEQAAEMKKASELTEDDQKTESAPLAASEEKKTKVATKKTAAKTESKPKKTAVKKLKVTK
ncbi:MAG: 30S ribosomal protein S17 [Patescibacteria group bacterium]